MKKLAIPFVAFCLSTVVGFSQTPTQSQARHMNSLILGVIDDYERSATLSDASEKRLFLGLFKSKKVPSIYNDFMGTSSYQQSVSALDYVNLVPDDGKVLLKLELSDIVKEGGFFRSGGSWHRRVSMSKYLMRLDSSVYTYGAGGVIFDSSQIYGDNPDFKLVFDFVYNEANDCIYIQSIALDGEKKEKSALDDEKFTVVVKSNGQYDDKTKSLESSLHFNDFDQAVAYYNNVTLDDDNVRVSIDELVSGANYNVVQMTYSPMIFRLKPRASFSLGSAYSVISADPEIMNASKAAEFGVDFGFMFPVNPILRLGAYVGAGLSLSSVRLNLAAPVSYAYGVDGLSGVKFKRAYDIQSATEGLSFTDFVFPVLGSAEMSLGKFGQLFINAGAKCYLNAKTTSSPYTVEASAYGIYPTGNVDSGNGFGPISGSFTTFLQPISYARKKFDISLYGEAGVDVNILKKILLFSLSAGYEYGLTTSFDRAGNMYYDQTSSVFPFIYFGAAKNNVPVRSLASCISYRRQALWLSTGLKYKF